MATTTKMTTVTWGALYGAGYRRTPEGWVRMYRKGQKVRFYTDGGRQVGPEQSNVAPAIAYSISQGWKDCCFPQYGKACPHYPAARAA